MKIVIAALASLAFATSAIAAVSSAPAEKQSTVKIAGQIEVAKGEARLRGGFSSKNRNAPKSGTSGTSKQDSWQ